MTGYYQNGSVTSYDQNTLVLPISLTGPSRNFPNDCNDEYKEGIHIQSTRDKLIVIGSLGSHNFDTFFAIPTINLCLHEYVYYGISVRTSVNSDGSVVIVGTANQTVVNITVPVTAYMRISTSWSELTPRTMYSYEIQRLQIMYISAFVVDLTGTKATSNKPISFFSGHECAFVPSTTRNCDPLTEQIPPTALWGTVYYFAPIASRTSYTIKIIAAYHSTTVNVYCNNTVRSHTINAGEYITTVYNNQEYCGVYASNDVLVTQFGHSYFSDLRGDAMMTLIPATSHYTNKIISSTLQFADPTYSPYHFINVVVLPNYHQPELISITSAKGSTQSLSSHNWVPIRRSGIIEAYVTQVSLTALVNATHNVFEVTHSNKTAQMTIIVYGFRSQKAYGHPGWIKSELNGIQIITNV